MSETLLKEELGINNLLLKRAALMLKSINHDLRQRIIFLLHQYGHLTVTEIYTRLRLDQSLASQHLAVLRRAGFVVTERKGKFITYSVNYRRLKEIHQFEAALVGNEKPL